MAKTYEAKTYEAMRQPIYRSSLDGILVSVKGLSQNFPLTVRQCGLKIRRIG